MNSISSSAPAPCFRSSSSTSSTDHAHRASVRASTRFAGARRRRHAFSRQQCVANVLEQPNQLADVISPHKSARRALPVPASPRPRRGRAYYSSNASRLTTSNPLRAIRTPQPNIDVIELARVRLRGQPMHDALRDARTITRAFERTFAIAFDMRQSTIVYKYQIEIGCESQFGSAEVAAVADHRDAAAGQSAVTAGDVAFGQRDDAVDDHFGRIAQRTCGRRRCIAAFAIVETETKRRTLLFFLQYISISSRSSSSTGTCATRRSLPVTTTLLARAANDSMSRPANRRAAMDAR